MPAFIEYNFVVFSNRLLRYLNLTVAVALVIAIAAVHWYAFRPLPRTSGDVSAPISRKATIIRDSLGTPHVAAETIEEALFLQGYVTAQDRLWQMDMLRRVAAGELSEVVGRTALESDIRTRRLRLRRVAERHFADLSSEERRVLAAYARGVNFFLETNGDRLPLEFSILGYDPRPWSVIDSILVGLQLHRDMTETWQTDLQKWTFMEGADPAKADFLFSEDYGEETQAGSNTWATSGNHSASGRPLLANDTHLQHSVPVLWYMVHLQAPGLNVIGFSVPGLPCVLVGHNERIAWGMTNLGFDVQDLYVERFDAQTGRYLYRGQTVQAQLEREFIRIKNGKPFELANWITQHGPLVVNENQQQLSMRWVAAEPGSFRFPLLDLNRARDWQSFTSALSLFSGPAQNFSYADVDGNTGLQVAGRLPVRRSYRGDLPVNGSTGEFEWDGFIPFADLPSVYNPPSGVVISANQNPFPESPAYRVGGDFAAPYRARQIRDLLASREAWRPEQMLDVQKDVYSGFAHFLAREVLAAYEGRGATNPAFSDAIAALRGWDGQMEKGAAAGMIISLTYQQIERALAEMASPNKPLLSRLHVDPSAVEDLLRRRPEGWFPDYDQLILESFADALDEGRRLQGRDVNKWDYGKYNQLLVTHPLVGRLQFIGKYFNIGPLPQSGSPRTVKQTTRRLGPSMRMVVDLSDWDRSLVSIATGQSAQLLSPHYKDQWDDFYVGRASPMQFSNVEGEHTLVFNPEPE